MEKIIHVKDRYTLELEAIRHDDDDFGQPFTEAEWKRFLRRSKNAVWDMICDIEKMAPLSKYGSPAVIYNSHVCDVLDSIMYQMINGAFHARITCFLNVPLYDDMKAKLVDNGIIIKE